MRKFYLLLVLIFSFCSLANLKSQIIKNQNIEQKQFDLKYKIEENKKLFKTNPEKAFTQIENLIAEAKHIHNTEGELNLLLQKADYYYYNKVSFEKLRESSEALKEKSIEYNNPIFKAQSHLYLFDAYCLNKLYDNALSELNEGLGTLDIINPKTDEIYYTRSKFYIAYANYYAEKKDSGKEIASLIKAIKEQENIINQEKKKESLFRDYSNLADAYSRVDKMDSAKFFVEKSMFFEPERDVSNHTLYTNYLVLGQVSFSQNKCKEAEAFYRKAEQISGDTHFMNIEKLYSKMILVYDCLDDIQSKKEYDYKLKDLKLKIFENKNESLHKIIEENKSNDKSRIYVFVIIGSVFIILLLLILLVRFRRKNHLLESQEKASQEYLQQQPELTEQSYKELIEMVKNNDPAFMSEFLKYLPAFTEKLQNFNSSIVQSEVEFCALLKLNLPTKDIARYKNIEPKTVQNKKYRIRKRLNIPENVDIYFWFSQL